MINVVPNTEHRLLILRPGQILKETGVSHSKAGELFRRLLKWDRVLTMSLTKITGINGFLAFNLAKMRSIVLLFFCFIFLYSITWSGWNVQART